MDNNEIIKTLSETLERVTKMFADVSLKQTELSNKQLDIFENSNKLIRDMWESIKKEK
ncbi:MAG: hypothetical protein RR854_00455 [Muribaculaceae bacterium]